MAAKVGCDPKGVGVITSNHSPVHAVRVVVCRKEKEKYRCVETPFSETCNKIDEAAEKKQDELKKKKKRKAAG